MFMPYFYLLSFTIFLSIITLATSKQYDNYNMKEDRPILNSAQVMNILREADHQVKKFVPTLSETVQSRLMPATLRLKNVDVEDSITPGNLSAKSASMMYKVSRCLHYPIDDTELTRIE